MKRKIEKSERYMVKRQFGFTKKYVVCLTVLICFLSMVLLLTKSVNAADYNSQNDGKAEWDSYWQLIYNSTDGLMSNQVTSVCQTDDGMIWFGTQNGLVSYDGKKYTEYGSFFLFDGVNNIIKTKTGVMWAATTKHGAAVDLGTRFHHFDDVLETSSNYTTALCECDGIIYVGTLRYMHTISPDEGYLVSDLSDNGIECVGSLAASNCIVAGTTSNGEVFFLRDKKMFARDIGKTCGRTAVCYADGYFVTGANDGTICVYSEEELNMIYSQSNSDTSEVEIIEPVLIVDALKGNGINKLFYESGKRLWVLCENSIGYFEIKESESINDIVLGEFVSCKFDNFESGFTDMIVDYQGNYWITSSNRGVLMLGKSFLADELAQMDLSIDRINGIYEQNNILYIAADDGLTVVDRNDKQIIETDMTALLKDVRCTDVTEYQEMLAVAVYGKGVYLFDKNGSLISYFDSDSIVSTKINAISVDDDQLFILTGEGCSIIKDNRVICSIGKENYSGNLNFTCALEESVGKDFSEQIFIGSNGGGVYIINNGQIVDYIDENSGISSKCVNDLTTYENGLFIATDQGINYYNGKKCIDIAGLPSELNSIKCISVCTDEQYLYVVGDESFYEVELSGLFNDDNESTARYRVLNSESGFIHEVSQGAHIYFDGNEFFIPCGNKVYSVNNNYGTDMETQFNLLVQGVKQDGKTAVISDDNIVNIDSETEIIEIYPSAIGYSVNDPYVRYALVGIDTDFNYVKKSELDTIEYENVPGGTYTLVMQIVETQDKDAQPLAEVNLQIIKKRSLVEKMWFRLVGMAAGFSVLMYFVFKDYKKNNSRSDSNI